MMVKDHFVAVGEAATSKDRHDRPAALTGEKMMQIALK